MSDDSVAHDQLRAFIERLERMHEERKAIAADISEIYAEAKGNGFDVPAIKTVLKIRGMDHSERLERESIVDVYLQSLGMQPVVYSAADADVPAAPSRAPARAHVENIEKFDPETGEIEQPETANTDPVANVEEEANGRAVVSDDAASREADDADRQRVVASGFTGEREPGSAKPVAAAQDREPIQPETANEKADDAFAVVKGKARLANAVGVEPSSAPKVPSNGEADRPASANTGGENVAAISTAHDTSTGEASTASPGTFQRYDAPTALSSDVVKLPSREEGVLRLRPRCQVPSACKSSGGKQHCWSCSQSMNETTTGGAA